MPVHAITHSVLGLHNNTTPIWDLGAILYWTSRNGNKLQTPAGSLQTNVTLATGERFDMLPSTLLASNPELWFDVGQQKYIQQAGDPTTTPIPRSGGCFFNGVVNRWTQTSSFANQRGFSNDAGITVTIDGSSKAQEIVNMDDGGPFDSYVVSNFSGSTQRIFRTQDDGGSGFRNFGFLCRRNDRGTINSATLELRVEDGLSADITTIATRYRRITDNGWYWVDCQGNQAGTDYTYIADIKAGITGLVVEAPFVLGSLEEFIMGPNPFEPTGGSTFQDAVSLRTINIDYTLTQGGWMGACIVPAHPSGTDYPVSVILSMNAGSNERVRFNVSSSTQRPIFIYDAAGGTIGNSLALDVSEFQQGVPLGMVVTWGRRNGTLTYTFFVNGKQVGILSIAPIAVPTIKNNGELEIGNQDGDNEANVFVNAIAYGNKRLPRKIGRALSTWFKRQAQPVIKVAGA